MAFSHEEGEIISDCVRNYYFVDDNNRPISFSDLPLLWSEEEIPCVLNVQMFLCGIAVSGQQIYKKVIAWRPEITYALPEIYVLSTDKIWMQLQRPRKSFEDTIKSILITVHCLHFVKRNPQADRSALLVQLHKAFSSYEVESLEKYLCCHLPLIKEAVLRENNLAISEFLPTLLSQTSIETGRFHEENHTTKKFNFIVDGQDDIEDSDSDDDSTDGVFDSVCVLCDNGGEVLCCEDKCLRSFHPNINAGAESFCESLGYSDAQVEAIQTFFCNNCRYQQHQCFVCGKLGSSDQSSVQEVFQCANAECGYFYHPKCVAGLLHPCDKSKAKVLQLQIHSGESFVCPAHKCKICMKGEDKGVYELQFAVCRRCPKAYHRKCLPSKITFRRDGDVLQRAWDDLLPDRVLIYCLDHDIIADIATPERGHILFPNVEGKMQTISGLLSSKEKLIISKPLGNFTPRSPLKQRLDKTSIHCGRSTSAEGITLQNSLRQNYTLTGERASRYTNMDKSKLTSRNNHPLSTQREKYLSNSSKEKIPAYMNNQIAEKCTEIQGISSQPLVDAEMKSRILKLIKDSTSSIKMDELSDGPKTSSVYSSCVKIAEDKTFTEGKVAGYVESVHTALKILDGGGTLEDAKAVCGPQVLKQLVRWKRALSVYLAPVLHGKRYTSYGRHFTKPNKLEEIADRLKCYVQDGDTIVDFCCGSNDFSCLMRDRLTKMGKMCFFKNYDLFIPKNDFNFEQRDWMTVKLQELPAGSNLIMGLNPPFGIHASLANKFINKALMFKPKLLILIVPKETKRLDRRKKFPYDNIWEDDRLLSGKSFYLPGSVDANDKQMEQHNNEAPPLYLWSHPDWTAKHKAIARTFGHDKFDTGKKRDGMYADMDGMYADMEVDMPATHQENFGGRPHQQSEAPPELVNPEWNFPNFGPGPSNYTMEMQHPFVVSDANTEGLHVPSYVSDVDAVGMQQSTVVSNAYAAGMQHPSVVSNAYAAGMQHPDVVSNASAAEIQHPSVVSDSIQGVYHGAVPPYYQYPTHPSYYSGHIYPGGPGF